MTASRVQRAIPLLLGLLLTATLPGLAVSDVAFYHSPEDNGQVGDAAVSIEPGVAFDLNLYLDGGSEASTSGELCSDGDGDELCGWNILVVLPSGMVFESFTPDPSGDIVYAIDEQEFRANGLDVFSPSPDPVRLGTLRVQSSTAGDVLLKSGMAAGAALQIRQINRRRVTLTVPEPAQAILGLAALGALAWLRRRRSACAVLGAGILSLSLAVSPSETDAAEIIVNEYNGVAPSEFLNRGTQETDGDGNSGEAATADPYWGRIGGNGGDWIEFVVIADGLDMQGYRIDIEDDGELVAQLVFSDDLIWSSIAAGTIITVAEELETDLSHDPEAGDYWMNVQAHDEGDGLYITPSDFSTSNNDTLIEIFDADGQRVFGPVGEGVQDGFYPGYTSPGVNSREVFRLEADPSPAVRGTTFYDDADDSSFGLANSWGDGVSQNFDRLRAREPWPDSDADGIPDDGDLSGIVGDRPCTDASDTFCDDNCPFEPNPLQSDLGNADGSGPDGVGDACQCGDTTNDGQLAVADLDEVREELVDPASLASAPRKCPGAAPGRCDIVAAVRLKRALQDANAVPSFEKMCAAGAEPEDPTAPFYNPARLLDVTVIVEPESWEVLRREGFGGTECAFPNFLLELRCRFNAVLEAFSNPPVQSPYNWYMADIEIDRNRIRNAGARKKGFIGSVFGGGNIRPSFKFDFLEFVRGQRLHGLERMTLNNNNQDVSRVKTCTNYRFLREIGLAAPRCNLAHIQVNAEDLGIYSNIDPVREPLLARHFGDGTGRLYEGQGAADFFPGRGPWFEPKSDAAAADMSEIYALINAIQIPDPEERLAAIEGIVNVEGFLDLWAGEGIAGLWDGYVASANNYLFYVNPTTGLIEFMPWGADHGLGDQDFTHCTPAHLLRTITPRSALALALYESETFRERLVDRIEYVVENVWDPESYIDEMDRLTVTSGGATWVSAGSKNWMRTRRDTVRAEIANGPPDISDVPPRCDFIP